MEIIDDQPRDDSQRPPEPDVELDGVKIRQFTALRRSAIRMRSWLLIGAAVCAVGAMQLLILAVQLAHRNRSWGVWQTLYIAIAGLAVFGIRHFLRKAGRYKREIEKPLLKDPEAPPDFSTLGDGSDRWKNLEDIR
jgi:hypothetical protein